MDKVGILLTNIGTPVSSEPEDVGTYLSEFLMDPLVIDIPWIFRWILIQVLVVPKRKFASSEAYKKIWMKEGSPLLVYSQRLHVKLVEEMGSQFSVKLGMRYSKPSIQEAMTEFRNEKVTKLLVIPMYPQFADSSTTSCLREVEKYSEGIQLKLLDAFYDQSAFIDSYAQIVSEKLKNNAVDYYLFSYHGVPERQIKRLHPEHCFKSENCCEKICDQNLNCYRAQCVKTTDLLAKALGLKASQFSISFQSRLGRTKWIEPYTDFVLPELAAKGVKKLAVICPSFVADCLETLEEIGIRGKSDFIKAGGEELQLIPCLNDDAGWVKELSQIIRKLNN